MPYLISFISAAVLSAAFVPVARAIAFKVGAVATPGGRHIHTKPTPRLGGIAVAVAIKLVVLTVLIIAPTKLHFVNETILGIDKNLFGVWLGAVILFLAGIWDDIKPLKPWPKLALQTLATLTVVAFGVQIHWITNPLGGLNIIIGNWSYLIVPIWLLMMINVMNWFDGLDGLSSGLSLIACVAIVILSLQPFVNQPATALLAAIVAGAALGFLPWNWHPAKIFLGDSGSMLFGYFLGVFAIISGAKFATAALVLGIPILDAFWVVGRRILSGQNPMKADRKHLHHRFLDAGFSPRASVLILYAIAAIFGTIALVSGTSEKVRALGVVLVVMLALGSVLFLLEKRKTK